MLAKIKTGFFIVLYSLCALLFMVLLIQTFERVGAKEELNSDTPKVSPIPNANKNNFELIVTAENGRQLPRPAQKAIENALNERWDGPAPAEGKFYLPNLRLEKNWAFATIFFHEEGVTYEGEGESPLSNAFMMMLSKDKNKEWMAARSDETEGNDVIRNIPDKDISPNEKREILFHPGTSLEFEPTGVEIQTTTEERLAEIGNEVAYTQTASAVDYRMPWDSSEGNFTISRSWHGGGHPLWGAGSDLAVDFGHPSNTIILSPVSGTVFIKCLNPGSYNQGMVAIKAHGTNEIINLWHLEKSTVPSSIVQGSNITQGQYLGKMVVGFDNEANQTCPLYSQGTHLHVVYPYKPFTIDSYSFNTNYTVNKGNENIVFDSTKIISTNSSNNSCSPPNSGDWKITGNCTLTSSKKVSKNLIIENGKTLSMSGNINLDMDLKNYKILIKPDAKLLLKNGAKIN